MKKHLWAGMLLAPVLLLSACSGKADTGGQAAGEQATNLRFAVVTHGSAGDAFWDVVKNGAEAAGKEHGVKVTYQGDGDPQKQSQLIEAAISEKVDGLVVSMANPDALKASVEKAVKAGIPVVTINSGQEKSAEFGALTHVGQSEVIAGRGAGGKLKEAGIKHLVCVIHEAGNIGLEQRCQGAKEALGGQVENLQVDINDVANASATIKAKLQADKSVDGVLTLNPAVGVAARDAVRDSGSSAKVATFDLSGDVIDAVKNGEILFAVDQQQYLQGYLPIVFLKLYKTNLNTVGGGQPVLTGPGFVTKENADQVAKLAEAGTR
ncbi:sugar ABC transporter substrate-binding protein [Carbonactinospora thermoautotrophica]|uniref:ABC-type sugar transport system periplasmic component-like protein n=1 Tax=Carbonactinospora thermoautotrophica TaxID=1469144 RepID=A0A132N6A8_9ACTN|nr:sugar ABC transporter substrate-binding protein [Carbonactinospora thermoautotrophica]KWX01375.1 ABC-type sugar transport system periplasmic component-like protein [Carbonactinospora thermoautotrophica]KWX05685.1 sugar ABC transporter substrate-binding protein [Carbonactinospora thermoautotrophica]KWX07577.1 sugar ABC transporter substrate-binding protein [Carbonactinospora thermoautotrophica]